MFALLGEIFSYSFLVRALVVGSLVALCAALLGVSLVLKRYSMIGDGLSHVGFGALSIAMAMNAAPLAVAIPVVILAAFLLLRISQNSRLGGDSAIALIASASLAAGVLVTCRAIQSAVPCRAVCVSMIDQLIKRHSVRGAAARTACRIGCSCR